MSTISMRAALQHLANAREILLRYDGQDAELPRVNPANKHAARMDKDLRWAAHQLDCAKAELDKQYWATRGYGEDGDST